MRDFLAVLLECSVAMSVLILGLITLTPWLSKRYASKWLYYAWLVIVAGLIIPFRFHTDTALIRVSADLSGMRKIIPGNAGGVAEPALQAAAAQQELPAIPWHQLAGCLWIVGAIILLIYHGLRHYHFISMVNRWGEQANDPRMLETLKKIKNEMGITRQVKLQICSCVSSPMMTGFLNPVILLPRSDFSTAELPYILKHELVHFKRKDLWYKSLVILATAIHWFNPVVYLMARAIALQCEVSCDAEVVNETDINGRLHYIETILGVIKNQSRMKTAFTTNFYGGKEGMKKRIFSIMDTTKKKTGIIVFCLVLIGIVGTGMVFAANKDVTSGAYSADAPMSPQENEIINKRNKQIIAKQYAVYEKYGLTYNQETDDFYYDGKLVRYFSDKLSSNGTYNSFTRSNGVTDLIAVRNANDELTGIAPVSREEYDRHSESIIRAQGTNTQGSMQERGSVNKAGGSNGTEEAGGVDNTLNGPVTGFSEGDPDYADHSLNAYLDYGISYDKANKQWIFHNKPIHYFSDADAITYVDNSKNAVQKGVSLEAVRKSSGQIDRLVEITK